MSQIREGFTVDPEQALTEEHGEAVGGGRNAYRLRPGRGEPAARSSDCVQNPMPSRELNHPSDPRSQYTRLGLAGHPDMSSRHPRLGR